MAQSTAAKRDLVLSVRLDDKAVKAQVGAIRATLQAELGKAVGAVSQETQQASKATTDALQQEKRARTDATRAATQEAAARRQAIAQARAEAAQRTAAARAANAESRAQVSAIRASETARQQQLRTMREAIRLRKEEDSAAAALSRRLAALDRQSRQGSGGNALRNAFYSTRFNVPGAPFLQPLAGRTLAAGPAAVAAFGAMGVGSSLLQGAGAAIGQAADLEQALSQIRFQAKATDQQLSEVRATARALGADLTLPGVSSTDAARAMLELVKAGLSLDEAMKASRGTLALSAAATIEVGDAAKITANTLNAFKLSGSEAGRVADLLAAASASAQGEITDFGAAMQQAGAFARQTGVSVEDTTTALTLMARAGIVGSDAGTSLKVMFQRLAPESAEARRAMKELGVSAYDSTGALKPLREIVNQYSEALSRASAEQRTHYLSVIFGQDAVRAATEVLLAGRDAYDSMKKSVTESGAAMGMAGAKADGLKGALEGLNSTLETFGEKHASRILGFLTELVRLASNGITAVDNLAASFGRLSGTKLPGPTGYLRTINEALDAYNQRVANESTPIGKAVQLREDIATLRTAQANNARPAWDLSARWRNSQSRGDIEAAIRRIFGDLTPDQERQMVGFPRPGLIASALAKAQQMDAASTSAIIGNAHAGRPFNVQGLPAGWPFNLPGMGGDPRLTTGAQEQAKKDAEKAARAAQAAARKQESERRRVESEKAEFLRVSAEADRLEADAARRARSAAFTGTLASLRDASDPLTARVLSGLAASQAQAAYQGAGTVAADAYKQATVRKPGESDRVYNARVRAAAGKQSAALEGATAERDARLREIADAREEADRRAAETAAADARRMADTSEAERRLSAEKLETERAQLEARLSELRDVEGSADLAQEQLVRQKLRDNRFKALEARLTDDIARTVADAEARFDESVRRDPSQRDAALAALARQTEAGIAAARERFQQERIAIEADFAAAVRDIARQSREEIAANRAVDLTGYSDNAPPPGRRSEYTDRFGIVHDVEYSTGLERLNRAGEMISSGSAQAVQSAFGALLTGKGSLGSALTGAGRGIGESIGQAAAQELSDSLVKSPLRRFFASLADQMAGGLLKGSSGLSKAAGELAIATGAIGNLTSGNARKKRNSWIGGLLGVGVGILSGGSSATAGALLKNFGLGASLGGLFAGGGRTDSRAFIGGERGAELFIGRDGRMKMLPMPGLYAPGMAGTVVSNEEVGRIGAALASGMGAGSGATVHQTINVENVNERSDADYIIERSRRSLQAALG